MKKVLSNKTVWVDEKGEYHRDGDLPASIFDSGKLHREGDRPAWEYNGDKVWYKNGVRHREGDKPAQEFLNGDRVWSKNGLVHREAVDEHGDPLPAVISSKFTKWVRNGVFSNPGYDWVAKLSNGTKGYYRTSELHFDNGVIHTLKDGVHTDRVINPKQDEKTENEELKCGVCIENKKCIVFNCGHITCFACSKRLDTCPTCRVKITTKTRVYI
jgi:hypothetical protein